MSTNINESKFNLGSTEAVEILNIPKQKLYSMRDNSTIAKNPRRPVLKRDEDWTFRDGKVMFTMESIEKIKQWRDNSSERKASIRRSKGDNVNLMVIIDGKAENITGKAAARILKIVNKVKQIDVAKQEKEQYLSEPKVEA